MQSNVKQSLDENTQSRNGTFDLNCSEETTGNDNQINEFHDIEIHRIEERVDERITDRIANDYALLLMKKPPDSKKQFEHSTTIISSEGAFQWNEEIAQWTCRFSEDNFTTLTPELSFLLQRASEITNEDEESAYSLLTLKQLNTLDQSLRIHQGDTILGYTLCEEIYLKTLNSFVWLFCQRCSEYDYPPLPEAYSKRLLAFTQRPLVLDITASLRVAAQSYILFGYFTKTYFQYTPESQDDVYQFEDNNISWILLALSSVLVVSLVLLGSGCVDKSRVLSVMLRLRWIEQSVIGMISNLFNYGPFLASATVIEGSFLPLMILAGVIGFYKRVGDVINIAEWTTFQFLLRSFVLSLTVGSFCTLGFYGLIDDILFLYDDDYTAASRAEKLQAKSIARYCGFALMMGASLFRHPFASLTTQHWGRTASQGMEGFGVALLDNYALFILIADSIFSLNGSDYFSPQKPVAPIFLCTLTALSFIAVFLVTFPTTPNMPAYSLEKNPIHPTWITKTLRFFNSIPGRCLSAPQREATGTQTVSKDGRVIQTSILSRIFRSMSVSHLYPGTHSREVQPPISNPMNQLNDSFAEKTKTSRGPYAI